MTQVDRQYWRSNETQRDQSEIKDWADAVEQPNKANIAAGAAEHAVQLDLTGFFEFKMGRKTLNKELHEGFILSSWYTFWNSQSYGSTPNKGYKTNAAVPVWTILSILMLELSNSLAKACTACSRSSHVSGSM